jgi:hypothetical protein
MESRKEHDMNLIDIAANYEFGAEHSDRVASANAFASRIDAMLRNAADVVNDLLISGERDIASSETATNEDDRAAYLASAYEYGRTARRLASSFNDGLYVDSARDLMKRCAALCPATPTPVL